MKLHNHETKVLYSMISEQMITIYVYYAKYGQFFPTQAITFVQYNIRTVIPSV